MSRAERERWKLAGERWPALQGFVSERLATIFGGHVRTLHAEFKQAVAPLTLDHSKCLAIESRDFLSYMAERYDDVGMLVDGFGVRGEWEGYPKDHGEQPGLRRVSMLYDVLIQAIRTEEMDWKP